MGCCFVRGAYARPPSFWVRDRSLAPKGRALRGVLSLFAVVRFCLERFIRAFYLDRRKAQSLVACYALGRPLPSIDEIGWEGVFTTPCANFPVVAGLP